MPTARFLLRHLGATDPVLVHRYVNENRFAHAPWEPVRDDNYFSLEAWRQRFAAGEFAPDNPLQCRFALLTAASDEVIGLINFTNVVGYPFHACHLGFAIATRHQGKGLMRDGLQQAISDVFERLDLNRIMANFMPRNFRSARLLAGLGFRVEGFAKNYLKINGKWEDHILTSLLRSDWIPASC
jgi:[ribosomal protein S5]-alanine N-acetyltransferase